MRSTETRARRMEVRPRKNSVSEGCEQCLAKGGNEISFCGNTVFLKSPAWEQNLAVQAGGAVAASHAHINTDFSFLFSSETEIDISCVGLDWKKKFHDQSYPFPWTVLAALEWILFWGNLFIHTLIYRHTPNAWPSGRFLFSQDNKQFWLLWHLSVSFSLYNLLQTLHFYKTYSRFNPTIATFFFFLLAKCVMVIVLTKLSWAMLTLLFMD